MKDLFTFAIEVAKTSATISVEHRINAKIIVDLNSENTKNKQNAC